ncbi:MAG: cellulase family glycosylhydrolase [Spirochaetes bacterium]|nr:cellulase family glycosylhydrolase [Spirochaetota bacterium]
MRIKDRRILDEEGRALILRGVNLGGSSKIPYGEPGWGLTAASLKNPKAASFVGRPFPLEEADSHFHRLARAGMTFTRLVVTWEAIEHEGPGIYDEAYLEYLAKILKIAESRGVGVFIDPHQDVWSRWSGGDGAPAWTLEALGINLDLLEACGAVVKQPVFASPAEKANAKSYQKMVWPANYNRYAAATMFSLFFGGKTYAPGLSVEGENIQDWLQSRYLAAFRHAYRRLKDCAAIAGWGAMNEPHYGFIGHQNLEAAENPMLPIGARPSPWQAICAASGFTQQVPFFKISAAGRPGRNFEVFNENGVSLFREGFACPWRKAGLWDVEDGAPKLLRADHFSRYQGRAPAFADDFLKPFIIRFINEMKTVNERSLFFIEGMPSSCSDLPHPTWGEGDPAGTVNAFHWYDGFALFTKTFRTWFTVNPEGSKFIFGRKKAAAFFAGCLAKNVAWAMEKMGAMPCLLGEFGLPFDLNKRKAFSTGDYSVHEAALSMYYDAVDANLLHSTIWNYTADNTHEHGDGWNDEDLSIFSQGAERAAAGWKRPYPMATAGVPLAISWDRKRRVFHYRFAARGVIAAPTLIYLPADFLGESPAVHAAMEGAGGPALRWEHDAAGQRLRVYNDGYSGDAAVTVRAR